MNRRIILCGAAIVFIVLVIAETIGSAQHILQFDVERPLSSLISCPPVPVADPTADSAADPAADPAAATHSTAISIIQSSDTGNNGHNRAASEYPSKRLEFVHIPKTGGTVIESEACRHNITWSICHFAYHEAAKQISMQETICPKGSLKYPWPRTPKYHQCPWWHLPPQYLELQGANPYAGANLFVVVRNVYDRIVSEYYYVGTYLTKTSADQLNDVRAFNAWLDYWLKHVSKMRRGDIGRHRTGNAPYFTNAGHWIPQYHFVYEHRRKIVKHVLRFEHLAKEFHALMELYNLPMRLPEKQVRKSHTKALGVWNMTRENLELMEMLYEDDFLEWGYEIMSEIIPPETLKRNRRIVSQSQAANPKNNV